MIRRLRALLKGALRQVCGATLALIVTLAFLQVVLRYGFAASIVWVEEVSVLLLLLLCWLGAVHLWLTRKHILVDLVARRGRARRVADRALDVAGLAAGAALAVVSLETLTAFRGIEMGSLELDASLRYYPILAGGAGIAVAALVNLLDPGPEPDAGSGAGGGTP